MLKFKKTKKKAPKKKKFGKNQEIEKIKDEIRILNQREELTIKRVEEKLEYFRGKKYTTNDAIDQYESFLKLVEQYMTDPLAIKNFNPYYSQIKRQVNILNAGKRAEKITFDSIKLWSIHVRYLSNTRFIYDDIDTEEDLIIIAPTGIFSVEIKNWKDSAILNRNGILVSKEDKKNSIDIINQMNRHRFCLSKILEDEEKMLKIRGEKYIHPIIVWQNNFSDLEDEFGKIPICCSNTLEYEILNYDKYEQIFSEEDIENVYHILNQKQSEERKYPSIITDDFINAFLSSIRIQYASERDQLEEAISEIEKRNAEKVEAYKELFIAIMDKLS